MDLAYFRFEQDASVASLPSELAVLLVGVAARQAASPTAMAQARMAPGGTGDATFMPATGTFDERMAARLRRWKEE